MATHVPGGNITYESVGPNSYIFTLTVFEDCSGTISVPQTAQNLIITNSCGFSNPSQVQLAVFSYGDEISQVCYPQSQNTTCWPNGTLPGIKKHIYKNLNPITLPGGCNDWTFY